MLCGLEDLLGFGGKTFSLKAGRLLSGGFLGRALGDAHKGIGDLGFFLVHAPEREQLGFARRLAAGAARNDAGAHELFDFRKRQAVQVGKRDQALLGIESLDGLNEWLNDGLFGDIQRQGFLARLECEQGRAGEFVEHQAVPLAFTDTASRSTDQARDASHGNATIGRQALQKNSQYRSPNHRINLQISKLKTGMC